MTLDELARKVVLEGVKKHKKCGRGTLHVKLLRMVRPTAVLCWGRSSKRNVICKRAEVGLVCLYTGTGGGTSTQMNRGCSMS